MRDHYNEIENHVLAFESDDGSTKPYGFGFNGSKIIILIMKEIMKII